MSENLELQRQPEQLTLAIVPTHSDSLPALMQLAKELVPTGFLPEHIKTPGQAVAIILAGRELGIGPMLALRSIYMLKGKVELSADLQLSLFKRDGGQAEFKELTENRAVLFFKHPNGDVHTETFTMEDARRAGLVRAGGNWTNYPKAMLRSRVITAGLKSCGFEPKMSGCYAPGEIGGPEIVEAELIDQSKPSPAVQKQPNGGDSAPIVFDAKAEKKFHSEAEAWLMEEHAAWIKANTNPQAWAYAVTADFILMTEPLANVTASKLFPSIEFDAAVSAIKAGKCSEAGAFRRLQTKLIERKAELAKAIAETDVGSEEQAAFDKVYGAAGSTEAPSVASEWFWNVICPVPNAGQKRADYEKDPDTIEGLYKAGKAGDDNARKRLFGFANKWKPEPRTVGDKTYNPSPADLKFREALDAFLAWEAAKGETQMREAADQI